MSDCPCPSVSQLAPLTPAKVEGLSNPVHLHSLMMSFAEDSTLALPTTPEAFKAVRSLLTLPMPLPPQSHVPGRPSQMPWDLAESRQGASTEKPVAMSRQQSSGESCPRAQDLTDHRLWGREGISPGQKGDYAAYRSSCSPSAN